IYILIAVGAVMMFVGFLGCYGAIQESQCLLGTISKELITFYDSVYDRGIFLTDSEQKQAAAAVLKIFHETLNCCGKGNIISSATMWLSNTCPQDKKTSDIISLSSNCHTKIKELFSEKIYLIGIAALVVAIIMIFEMIFSMVLCCGIRNSPVY
ncbi:CD81 antigen-like, partial [Sinocyclocheilus grahami]|uniref:CD81 antigen-like n=1 Tax=Sinocyclocheilus grahami TaxID=75366 RepID=UPI0007ACD8BD